MLRKLLNIVSEYLSINNQPDVQHSRRIHQAIEEAFQQFNTSRSSFQDAGQRTQSFPVRRFCSQNREQFHLVQLMVELSCFRCGRPGHIQAHCQNRDDSSKALTQNCECCGGPQVPKRFVGLIQMQCSPSFDCFWGKQTTPLHVGTSYTHNFGFYSKGNVSATHQMAWVAKGLRPLPTPFKGGALPLKFPPYSLFRAKGGRKTINVFNHFHGLHQLQTFGVLRNARNTLRTA